jgi:hypothetical protein
MFVRSKLVRTKKFTYLELHNRPVGKPAIFNGKLFSLSIGFHLSPMLFFFLLGNTTKIRQQLNILIGRQLVCVLDEYTN